MGSQMKQTAEFRSLAKQLYGLLDSRRKRNFIFILLAMALSAVLTQVTPKAIGWLTDDILLREQIQFGAILPVLGVILVVNVANQLVIIFRRLLVEDTATRTEKKARGLAIASLLKAPLSFYRDNMTGNIHGRLNRCLEGTVRMEKLLFMDFAPAIFNSLAAVVVIFTTLPAVLALPMMLVIPIGVGIVLRQIHTQRGIRVELLDTKAAMDGSLVELLGGIQVIRVTDSTAAEERRFEGKSETLRAKEMTHHIAMARYDCLKFLNQVIFTVLMIGVSAWLATRGIITVGAVLTAYLCFNQLLKPLEELHRILDELSESMILAQDFFRMARLDSDFSYEKAALPAHSGAEKAPLLELENLRLAYGPEREVLRGIDLKVEQGTFLGLAGPSGCGKSSLIKAVCRLEPCEGKLLLEGRELESWSREELARVITLVPQTPFLIAGTIRENICYGLKETPAPGEVEEAARKACLGDFLEGLPQGLDTILSEGGSNLSGGQRQRIALARIFLRRPRLLILDEATSALDNTSERFVQNQIEALQRETGMTVLSIAHRLTTLQNAHRILVMDKGKLVQEGSYKELVETPGIFQDMYYGRLK